MQLWVAAAAPAPAQRPAGGAARDGGDVRPTTAGGGPGPAAPPAGRGSPVVDFPEAGGIADGGAPLKLNGSLYATPTIGGGGTASSARDPKGGKAGAKGKKGHGYGLKGIRERSAELRTTQGGGKRRLQQVRKDDAAFRVHLRQLKEMQDLGALLGSADKERANLELLMPELTPR
eukprot:gene17092-59226_t